MRYMLLQAYGGVELEGCPPMYEWDPADVRAHIEFQHALNAELLERGEFVDAQGLADPDQAKFVVSDGTKPPKVIDGPYPESKELLAGYRLVDVDSLDRALEIAARSSASPGPGGVPIRQQIEVRQVIGAPDPGVRSTPLSVIRPPRTRRRRGPAARPRAAGPRRGRPPLRRLRRRRGRGAGGAAGGGRRNGRRTCRPTRWAGWSPSRRVA